MHRRTLPRARAVTLVAAVAVGSLGLAACSSTTTTGAAAPAAAVAKDADAVTGLPWGPSERLASTQGDVNGGESFEARTAAQQFLDQRLAPGIVAPGAYGAVATSWQALPSAGGTWTEQTGLPYNADDERYRDYYSNSSGGAGNVTGRISALAASGSYVFAGGAQGGVWRSSDGGGHWTPIADSLPALSSGDLQINKNLTSGDGAGWLWYATGDSSTGSGSYVGSGVYVLADPTSGTFTSDADNRVGGDELESSVINALRFSKDGLTVYAATDRGLWSHSATTRSGSWTRLFAQNPAYLPGGPKAGSPSAAYKNWVTDLQIDPKNPRHIVLAADWRSGDPTNGFYESTDGGSTWAKVNLNGGIDATDIGNTTFAYSADGSKLYAVVQSAKLLNKYTGNVSSYLQGVYVSNSGNPAGPWTSIATSQKLASSGSALKQSVGGKGYGPGIQSWYNQFLAVDPKDPQHVYLGLEEVYETHDGGATWQTVGPYWNFNFSCWDNTVPDTATTVAGCPRTTHSDQHSIAFGTNNGTPFVFVGNDGGVYGRPIAGKVDASGHATDWKSFNDGTIDALQYYSVGVGKVDATNSGSQHLGWSDGVIVSGGMQDNGGSILHPGEPTMGSNFGGDGGYVLVDPNNGCNIVQEYVYLDMRVTNTCAAPTDPHALTDIHLATTYDIAPPDVTARFIAPFAADPANIDSWIAGGKSVWTQSKGFGIRSGSDWTQQYDLGSDPTTGAAHTATAVALSGTTAYVTWCGPCNPNGFQRGIATGTLGDPSSWHQLSTTAAASLPMRYPSSVAIDPTNAQHAFVTFSGFSRNWVDGPGAGVGHVFETTDGGATWTDVSGDLPDVPTNSVVLLPGGSLLVGTDMGVAVGTRSGAAFTWQRLGDGLPFTVVTQATVGPDGKVYAATFGRGLWTASLPG